MSLLQALENFLTFFNALYFSFFPKAAQAMLVATRLARGVIGGRAVTGMSHACHFNGT
jgi:hypothetical protein